MTNAPAGGKGREREKSSPSKSVVLAPASLIAHLPVLKDAANTLPNDYTIVVLPRSRSHHLRRFIQ
jgi:hypothetical protein